MMTTFVLLSEAVMFSPRLLFVALGLAASAWPAQAETFRSAYTVSYFGIPIARSSFSTTLDGDRFTVDGKLATTGIANIFDETKGTIAVAGSVLPDALRTQSFRLDYTTGKKKKSTVMRFKGGNVDFAENVPPSKTDRKDWVKVSPDLLKGVMDPFAATMVKASSLADVCKRTLKTFDGAMRADMKLSPDGEGTWNDRPTAICKARFEPIAGYRAKNKSISYLRDRSEISLEFTALGKTGFYAPVRASAGTRIGTVSVEADELGTD